MLSCTTVKGFASVDERKNSQRDFFHTISQCVFSLAAPHLLTFFDALNLLVVDRSNRDTAAKDIPHMLPTNVFCLLHNVAVVAGRADVHGRFGTREDAGTNGKTAGEI